MLLCIILKCFCWVSRCNILNHMYACYDQKLVLLENEITTTVFCSKMVKTKSWDLWALWSKKDAVFISLDICVRGVFFQRLSMSWELVGGPTAGLHFNVCQQRDLGCSDIAVKGGFSQLSALWQSWILQAAIGFDELYTPLMPKSIIPTFGDGRNNVLICFLFYQSSQ